MIIDEIKMKDLIIKYFYSSLEIKTRGKELYNLIKIKNNKNNQFKYIIDIDKILKELELKDLKEENLEFVNLIKYLYKTLNCNLFIFEKGKL